MAKGSPLMGTQRGRLGESVLYRKQGEQFERAYIRHPSNPNSQRQQVQRMITATCINAYSKMKSICDHSWEGVPTGLRSMSRFLSLNAEMLRRSITADAQGIIKDSTCEFSYKGNNSLVLNPYLIARGSLREIPFYDVTTRAELGQTRGFTFIPMWPYWCNGDVKDFINQWLWVHGVTDDSYLTCAFVVRYNGHSVGLNELYRFHWIRWYAYDSEGDLGHANRLKLEASSFAGKNIQSTETKLGSNGLTQDGCVWGIDLGNDFEFDEEDIVAFCFIQSKWKNNKPWLRSNASLHLRTGLEDCLPDYPKTIDSFLDTYANIKNPVGSPEFILNGGDE